MDANTLHLVTEIFEVCIIPLLAVLTTYIVKYIKVKSGELEIKVDNELSKKYISMLTDTITQCVIATNQTYVEALKKQGKFDKESQEVAFKMTLDAVLGVLTEDAKIYLAEAYGDLDAYITSKIEATVNENKIIVNG